MRKSPLTLTYSDLSRWAEKQLKYAKERRAKAEGNGVTDLQPLTHDVACVKEVLRLLEKCEPGRQANLFTLFNESR